MDNRKFLPLIVAGVAGLIFIIALSSSIFLTIKPGEAGVLFKKFSGGLDKSIVYEQGFHIIAPWNKVILYEVRQIESSETLQVLSSNLLDIQLDVTLFHQAVTMLGWHGSLCDLASLGSGTYGAGP